MTGKDRSELTQTLLALALCIAAICAWGYAMGLSLLGVLLAAACGVCGGLLGICIVVGVFLFIGE